MPFSTTRGLANGISRDKAPKRGMRRLTLVDWFQLGELRRFSIGEISDKGRGMTLPVAFGSGIVLLLVRRKGWT